MGLPWTLSSGQLAKVMGPRMPGQGPGVLLPEQELLWIFSTQRGEVGEVGF
jgi:hypothetical protein